MKESMTRRTLIDPALQAKGWICAAVGGAEARWEEEYPVALGRIGGDAKHHNPKEADYVFFVGKTKVAVLEAKREDKSEDEAEAQAKFYAAALGIRFTYATNGHKLIEFDLLTMAYRELKMAEFPTPSELASRVAETPRTGLETTCAEIPYSRAGGKLPRYYQERAVEAVLAKFGKGGRRALLTLATGTGKTFIAFQLCHKLTEAKWQKQNLGVARPKILFVADRNILADQAYDDFDFYPGDCFRYEAGTELKLTRYIYFTLFQTLIGENGEETKYKQFPRDFFDLVIIDECHRGVSNDESRWLTILKWFDDAAHLGLTATPKCDENGETYKYFGEPVYRYTLKQGIADGFLSPYDVMRCKSTLEKYKVEEGDYIDFPEEIDSTRDYSSDQLERKYINILERDRHFVDELFKVMPLKEKAIVFCVNQRHAHRIARLISAEAARRGISSDMDYCVTVTADTGEEGEKKLRIFRKTSEKIPTILTTSQKLTTGVDAKNIRSIVIFRNVSSPIEFKQIVGRGTRVCPGKPGFTIYDFTGATEHMKNDDFWDDDPKCPKCGQNPCVCEHRPPPPPPPPRICPKCGLPITQCVCPKPPKKEVNIKLSSGRTIDATWVREIVFDNKLISVKEFLELFIEAVKSASEGPEDLRAQWSAIDTRDEFLAVLNERGFSLEMLKEVQKGIRQQEYDVFDVILELAYDVEPVTRAIRAERVKVALTGLTPSRRAFAEIILRNEPNGDRPPLRAG